VGQHKKAKEKFGQKCINELTQTWVNSGVLRCVGVGGGNIFWCL